MARGVHLTKVAARGGAMFLSVSVLLQGCSLITQIVLGWLLSRTDFGVYALAMGIYNCVVIFKDGGLAFWLARLPRDEFRSQSAAAFWVSLVTTSATMVVLLLCAPIVGWVYDDRNIGYLVVIAAISVPLDAYALVGRASLQVHMRFAALSRLNLAAGVVRYGSTIGLALFGFGPYSLMVPLVPVALFSSVVVFFSTELRPWKERVAFGKVRSLFNRSRWGLLVSASNAWFRNADYLVLGLVAAKSVVGVYFFAYQLSVQLVSVFGESIRKVLVPSFSTVREDRERRLRGLYGAVDLVGLFAPLLFWGLMLNAGPGETLLWHGRWAAAIGPIQLLAIAMPFQLFAIYGGIAIQAEGSFGAWAGVVTARGVGLGAIVWVASWFGGDGDAAVVAAFVSPYLAVTGLIEGGWLLSICGLRVSRVLPRVIWPYLVIGAAALIISQASSPILQWSPVPIMLSLSFAFVALAGIMLLALSRRQLFGALGVLKRALPRRGAAARNG